MTNTAEIIQFPRREDVDRPDPEHSGRGPQVEDGYTRIANELLEQVMAAPLTLREMRVVMAVIRLTYGWNRKQARIPGGLLAKLTGMPATKASKAMAALVAKNVVIRHGGSRSPVSLNKHADQWVLATPERKTPPPKQAKSAEIDQTGQSEPKGYDSYQNGKSECYQNGNASKDRKDKPLLTTFEGGSDSTSKKTKPVAAKKTAKAKPTTLDLTNLPNGVSEDAAKAFIDHRKALKKPLTQRALMLAMGEAMKASEAIPDMTPDQAIDEAILAGWQGVKAQWLINRVGGRGAQPQRNDGRMGFAQPLPVGSYGTNDLELPEWARD